MEEPVQEIEQSKGLCLGVGRSLSRINVTTLSYVIGRTPMEGSDPPFLEHASEAFHIPCNYVFLALVSPALPQAECKYQSPGGE